MQRWPRLTAFNLMRYPTVATIYCILIATLLPFLVCCCINYYPAFGTFTYHIWLVENNFSFLCTFVWLRCKTCNWWVLKQEWAWNVCIKSRLMTCGAYLKSYSHDWWYISSCNFVLSILKRLNINLCLS